jgi:hypothetical protein
LSLGSTYWSRNISSCPDIKYTLLDTNSGNVPDNIFSIENNYLKVQASLRGNVGTYNL